MMTMKTLEILSQHYELEYHYTQVGVRMAETPKAKRECAWFAVQRCLGMATIAQSFGASYEEVEPLFEEIKEKIMALEG